MLSSAKLLQSCPTQCDPIDCSLLGSSVHAIPQARILELAACPPPGDLLDLWIQPTSMSPELALGFTASATWEALDVTCCYTEVDIVRMWLRKANFLVLCQILVIQKVTFNILIWFHILL